MTTRKGKKESSGERSEQGKATVGNPPRRRLKAGHSTLQNLVQNASGSRTGGSKVGDKKSQGRKNCKRGKK